MKVTGTSKDFLKKLKHARKNKKMETQDKYAEAFLIKRVYCNTCEKIAVASDKGFIVAYRESEIEDLALKEHQKIIAETGIICTDAVLIIAIENCLIDRRLLTTGAATVPEQNKIVM